MVEHTGPILVVGVVALVILAAFPIVLSYATWSGEIALTGLLSDKASHGLSQARSQLLLITIAGAALYLIRVVQAARAGATGLPDVPAAWLGIIGASHGIFIGGKSASLMRLLIDTYGGKR